MAKIFNPPTEIEIPKFNWQTWREDEEQYIEKLRTYLKEINPKEEECGEIIAFPVADGQARYMVASITPYN